MRRAWALAALCLLAAPLGCTRQASEVPVLAWYVFEEGSGSFAEAARRCTQSSGGAADGAYRIEIRPLPADADQQREQLVRRLAARDDAIDLIGMDVIWTAEFARAGWIRPWPAERVPALAAGRIAAALASADYEGRLWAVPFTTNVQLLWYRTDRVPAPPATWDAMIELAESLGEDGTIQVQGERYEGLTVFFVSLLASAGGAVLGPDGERVGLSPGPTREALRILHRLARSGAADPALATAREDQGRLAFEAGGSSFMVNYSFVWASARERAPEIAAHMGWARWPRVDPGRPSRVTVGGLNIGVGAYSRHPDLARAAAECIASEDNQRLAAARGGLPPTLSRLYDDPAVRATFPFADLLRETLGQAVQRPETPVYNDVSLAISRTLHPLAELDPDADLDRLRASVARALRSEGLF